MQPAASVAFTGCIQVQPECNLREALGERLKQVRAALGLTQKEWSEASGMPLPSLKDYEGCKRLPGAEALCLYASAGVRVDWLLTGEGPMLRADWLAEHAAELVTAFENYWMAFGDELRREDALTRFVEAYNSGKIEPVTGFRKITATQVSAAYDQAQAVPATPAPAPQYPAEEIDERVLAICIQGILEADRACPPARAAKLAVEFYGRLKAMEMEDKNAA